MKFDSVAEWGLPMGVHVLHIAFKAAELGQEFGFVEVATPLSKVGLDSRLFIESPVSVVLRLLD